MSMNKHSDSQFLPSASRRQLAGLLCGSGLLALAGCGGGSSSEVPPVAPQITLQPQSVSVTVGQSVTLQVQASGSNLVYQWLRDGVAIAGATASTLVLVTQASDSDARFSVRVSNEVGTVTSAEAVLTLTVVPVAPQIAVSPQSVSALLGQSVTFQVQATGSNLVYQWLRNGVSIAGATASTLVLLAQASDSAAHFSVRVSNEVGTVTSAEAVLTLTVVPVAPQITLSPQSITAALGQSVSLQVVASGSNLAYQWLRNGADIAGANVSTLVFTAQATDDQARFSVRVSNEVGTVTSAEAVLTLSLQIEAGISLLAGQIGGTGPAQDGVGEQARFGTITGTCVDRNGNLYLIDTSNTTLNTTLRKVSPFGVVTTLFQNFPADSAVAVGADGNFYGVRDRAIIKVGPDGSQQVLAGMPGVLGYADGPGAQATFARPTALAFDAQGNLLVADAADFTSKVISINLFSATFVYGGTVRKINPAGVVSTIAGKAGQTLSSQNLFYTDAPSLPSSVNASQDLLLPNAIACDGQGNIYVADYLTNDIKKIDRAGSITVLATGPTTGYGFFWEKCSGVAVLGNGEVLFGQSDGQRYDAGVGGVYPFYPCDGVTYPIPLNGSPPTRVVLKRIDLTGAVHDFAGGQSFGAKPGPLPGSLGADGPGGLVAAADNAVIRCTRTAVLRIRVS